MTEVHFYSGVANKTSTACMLVRKAVQRGRKVVVYSANRDELAQFGQALWSSDPTGFVPHVRAGDLLAERTPVVLTDIGHADENAGHVPHHEILVNLDLEPPLFFSRFEILVEVVSTGEEERIAGRNRWKFYKDRGYKLDHHPQEM
jgi:DNA polymerase-3 subunit chi